MEDKEREGKRPADAPEPKVPTEKEAEAAREAQRVAAADEREQAALRTLHQANLDAAARAGELKPPVAARSRVATKNPAGYLAVGPADQVVTIPIGAPLKPGWRWASTGDQSKAKERAETARKEAAARARKE